MEHNLRGFTLNGFRWSNGFKKFIFLQSNSVEHTGGLGNYTF